MSSGEIDWYVNKYQGKFGLKLQEKSNVTRRESVKKLLLPRKDLRELYERGGFFSRSGRTGRNSISENAEGGGDTEV